MISSQLFNISQLEFAPRNATVLSPGPEGTGTAETRVRIGPCLGQAAVIPFHPINHVPGAAETPAYANPGFATNLKIELSCTTVPGLNSQASGSQLPPRAARRGREVGHSHSLGMFC